MPRNLLIACFAALVLWPATAPAQDNEISTTVFADDRYIAGRDIEIEEETAGDLFAAGEDVTLSAPVAGAAHMAGRRVTIAAPVSGALYAAGYQITAQGDQAGPISLFGAEVTFDGTLAQNLRAFASELAVSGEVAGSAILAADEMAFDAVIAGDVMLTTREVAFGEDARIDGQLILYAEEGEAPTIPDRVVPADRVELRDPAAWDGDIAPSMRDLRRKAIFAAIQGFAFSVVLVAAIAAAALFILPQRVIHWRERALSEPGRSLVWGFGTLSLIWGAGLVLALTVLGLLLLPAAILIGVILAYAGYVLGCYVLGVAIWLRLGKPMPHDTLRKVGLAALGALVAGLLALVPFLGWLFVMGLALFGLGALVNSYRARRNGKGNGDGGSDAGAEPAPLP